MNYLRVRLRNVIHGDSQKSRLAPGDVDHRLGHVETGFLVAHESAPACHPAKGSVRRRHSSSRKTTFITRCRLFLITWWLRMIGPNRPASNTRDEIQKRVSVVALFTRASSMTMIFRPGHWLIAVSLKPAGFLLGEEDLVVPAQ